MKLRVIGLVLAVLLAGSLILPGFAATAEDPSAAENANTEIVEAEAGESGIYLDGELVETLEHQAINNVYYVTVESFVAMLDSEAMVEEEDGSVTVNASTVTEVVDVTDAEAEGAFAAAPEGEEAAEANVVEETLTLSADAGSYFLVANDRYLYVENGLVLINEKVAAPIRVLAKAFNLNVDYDGETKSVLLTHQEDADAYLENGSTFYDSDTLYWLSRIIYSESGNQPLLGMLAVGNVVMNRVENPRFPNTIYEVLFQRNQFSPAASGSIYRTPSAVCEIAAKLVMDGATVLDTALFFNMAGMRTYASRNRTYVATIGDHAFYA